MAEKNLGKIAITIGGEYDSSLSYEKLVMVYYGGSSWVSKIEVPAGVEPSEGNSVYWQLTALKGEPTDVINNLTDGGTTAALSAEQGLILATEVAQLSDEWQEIKDANFNIIVQPHIRKEVITEASAIIDSDKFYIFENPVAALAVGFNPPESSEYAAQYMFQFTCPENAATTLSLPIEVIWNELPEIKAGKTYQVSVLENLAIITAWTLPVEEEA